MNTRAYTIRATRSAGSSRLFEGLGSKKAKKEIKEWEVEYVVKTERIPNSSEAAPKNVSEALIKWKGWAEPTSTKYLNNCKEELLACMKREDALEKFADCIREQLQKKRNEEERRLASQPSTSSAPPQTIDEDLYDFDVIYPGYKDRNNYNGVENRWKLVARSKEKEWNKKLEEKGIAPVYIVNWINDEPTKEFEFMIEPEVSQELLDIRKELKEKIEKKNSQIKSEQLYCKCIGKCKSSCVCQEFQPANRMKIQLKNGRLNEKALTHNFFNSLMLCGQECSCSQDCPSKAELKRDFPLIVFFTGDIKGYGTFVVDDVPAGTYVGRYAGHIKLELRETVKDIMYDYTIEISTEMQEYLEAKKEDPALSDMDPSIYFDGLASGSECRFFNNACGQWANMVPISVYTCDNKVYNDLMFFSRKNIEPGTELTFEYTPEKPVDGCPCGCHPDCRNTM